MNKLILTSALLFSVISQAEIKCFVASSPEQITVSTEDNKKIETAISAKARLDQEILHFEDGSTKPAELELAVESKSMLYKTVAIAFDEKDLNTYGVECDGGQVDVKLKDGKLTLISDGYLRGDIRFKLLPIGCHTGNAGFKKLELQEVSCQQ